MQATQITLKITLDKEIRRLTVDSTLTWDKLLTVLGSVFKARTEAEWKNTLVRYIDDEEDLCTISSDEELREAINLALKSARPMLRLVISTSEPAPSTQIPNLPEPQQLASLLQNLLENAAPHVEGVLAQLAHSLQTSIPQVPIPETSPLRPCRWGQNRQKVTELGNEGIFLMDAKDYVSARAKFVEQLSLIRRPWHRSNPLYNIACCDALMGCPEQALSFLSQAIEAGFRDADHMKSDEDLVSLHELPEFQALLQKASEQVLPTFGSRCPAFNRPNFARKEWFELQQAALDLMESKDPEAIKQARGLLEKQVQLSPHPWGQRIPLYNIACCEALLGNSDEALKYLKEAINAGYRNTRHIEGDADLESLRELDAFKELIASIKSGHRCKNGGRCGRAEQAAPVEQPEPVAEQPAVEQAVPVVEQPAVEQPEPVAEQPVEEPAATDFLFQLPQEFDYLKTQLEVLAQMGFVELKQNLQALVSAKGDVAQALESLLNQ